MKKLFHKILSLLLTVVMLFSTLSFTIDMHYCGNMLVDAALFAKAEGCGMEQPTSNTTSCTITKKSCCTDTQLTYEGQDELKISFDKLGIKHQVFVVALSYSYVHLFEEQEIDRIPFEEYPPPLLVKDIRLLNETFLI